MQLADQIVTLEDEIEDIEETSVYDKQEKSDEEQAAEDAAEQELLNKLGEIDQKLDDLDDSLE